jgi:hypothetical protein
MSRMAERLARLEAKLAAQDEVTIVTITQVPWPVVIDGSPATRVAAIKEWYAKHGVPMQKEHADEIRVYEKPAKTSPRARKTTRRKGARSR